jgi:DNA-binding NtrC family response regulator
VLSSTNIEIGQAMKDGRFREDLFYRLNVFTIRLPSLRERPEDLAILARHFVEEFAELNEKAVTGISPAALQLLSQHDWPGNVRELRNALERAVIVARGPLVEPLDLPTPLGMAGRSAPALPGLVPPPLTNGTNGSDAPHRLEDEVGASRVAAFTGSETAVDRVTLPIGTTIEEAERILIIETLKQTRQNKTRAAEVLGISTKTLHNKLKLYRQSVS